MFSTALWMDPVGRFSFFPIHVLVVENGADPEDIFIGS